MMMENGTSVQLVGCLRLWPRVIWYTVPTLRLQLTTSIFRTEEWEQFFFRNMDAASYSKMSEPAYQIIGRRIQLYCNRNTCHLWHNSFGWWKQHHLHG